MHVFVSILADCFLLWITYCVYKFVRQKLSQGGRPKTISQEEYNKILDEERDKALKIKLKQEKDAFYKTLISGKYKTEKFNPNKSFIYTDKTLLSLNYMVNGIYFSSAEDKLMYFIVEYETRIPKYHTKYEIHLSKIVSFEEETNTMRIRTRGSSDISYEIRYLRISILMTDGTRTKIQVCGKKDVSFSGSELRSGKDFVNSDPMRQLKQLSDALTARLAVYAAGRVSG